MTQLEWGSDGVARGNIAGINIWAVAGVPVDKINYLRSCGVRDSKQTDAATRYSLMQPINRLCEIGIGYVLVEEINELGSMTLVEKLALERALSHLKEQGFTPDVIWGDLGSPRELIKRRMEHADKHLICVSAASIAAKHFLDCWWKEAEKRFPEIKKYCFSKNHGYGQPAIDLLKKHGVCQFHRVNFKPVREYLEVLNNARNSA